MPIVVTVLYGAISETLAATIEKFEKTKEKKMRE